MSGKKETGARNQRGVGQPGTLEVLLLLGAPALAALCVYALPGSGKVFATGLFTASASFAAGALFGFLFGIPRSLTSGEVTSAEGDTAAKRLIEPNTNLEQISDWLTKILIGVGLVQLQQISGGVESLADDLAPGLGGAPNGSAVAVMLMVSFSITGFVGAYLYTRLRLQSAFALADLIEAAVDEKADAETKALALVRNQLDPGGEDGPAQSELNAALEGASPGIRSQAFYQARDQRRANWRGDKRLVGLTIPVYRALIASDSEKRFHRNYGELGYALKDQESPDLPQARDALSTAIEIRDRRGSGRHALYEFNRAACNVLLDNRFVANQPAMDDTIDAVVSDLLVAAGSRLGRKAIQGDQHVRRWLALNDSDVRVAKVRERIAAA